MADIDDGLDAAFEGFGDDKLPTEKPKTETPKAPEEEEKPKETPSKENPVEPVKPKEGEETTPPADPAQKPEEGGEAPKAPETPPAPAEPATPLTKDDVKSVVTDLLTGERASGKELETTTNDVLEAYYPGGLSNVLVDEKSGKELKSPQDVIDASGGDMTMEQASQWLMNEQFKLDQSVSKIKDDARKVAETTLNFKRDATAALQKYEPLFKWQPALQKKVYDRLMSQVKADTEKGVILSAPDVMDHYDFYLEPYQKAFEFANGKPATNPVPAPAAPAPATPGADDRLDEGGDGGQSPVNDPNDFAQQVGKELSKGL